MWLVPFCHSCAVSGFVFPRDLVGVSASICPCSCSSLPACGKTRKSHRGLLGAWFVNGGVLCGLVLVDAGFERPLSVVCLCGLPVRKGRYNGRPGLTGSLCLWCFQRLGVVPSPEESACHYESRSCASGGGE